MPKKIHLIRTFLPAGTGGPVPPLELLHTATQIMTSCGDGYAVKITDMGIGGLSPENIKSEIGLFAPDVVCLNALAWEAGLAHATAAQAKAAHSDIRVIVCGQLAQVAGEHLLADRHVDFVIPGEPETVIIDLLAEISGGGHYARVDGIIYKDQGEVVATSPRRPADNLDERVVSAAAWDLIDIKAYARYPSWNGALKEKFYLPILTSRGCPFRCAFCRETYDRTFRARSPENVVEEMRSLQARYGVKEIHVFDAVFNCDQERAKDICRRIIASGLDISLAFPHGIRADLMTDELIHLLRQAGTYKVVYGIETASPRLQQLTGKKLDLPAVREVIRKTSAAGIITGGYFMLGFPDETEDEMRQTVDFALSSDLDTAAFFKYTSYDDMIAMYQAKGEALKAGRIGADDFQELGYYAVRRAAGRLSSVELNTMILSAQRRFYLNPRRWWRGIKKYPGKAAYVRNVFTAGGLLLQAHIMQSLSSGRETRTMDAAEHA